MENHPQRLIARLRTHPRSKYLWIWPYFQRSLACGQYRSRARRNTPVVETQHHEATRAQRLCWPRWHILRLTLDKRPIECPSQKPLGSRRRKPQDERHKRTPLNFNSRTSVAARKHHAGVSERASKRTNIEPTTRSHTCAKIPQLMVTNDESNVRLVRSVRRLRNANWTNPPVDGLGIGKAAS